jgi:hypothetical protein
MYETIFTNVVSNAPLHQLLNKAKESATKQRNAVDTFSGFVKGMVRSLTDSPEI